MESSSQLDLALQGFHKVDNAFYDLEMGDNPGGIFNATPPEHLHQMSGLTDYLFSHFSSILTPSTRNTLDQTSQDLYNHFHCQSERGFHSLSPFRNGVFVNTSSLSSKEKVARIFALYLILLSPYRLQKVSNWIGIDASQQWLHLFEAMLVYDAWMRAPEHDPKDIRGDVEGQEQHLSWPWSFQSSPCLKACRELMKLYKDLVQRTDGVGLKLTKFHQILHHVKTISEHGSMLNVDSGRPESTHKYFAKDVAKKTQRRSATLAHQSANRLSESQLIKDVKAAFISSQCSGTERADGEDSRRRSKFVGSRYVVNMIPLGRNCFEAILKWETTVPDTVLSSEMCESILQRLFFHPGVGGCLKLSSKVRGFTEYKPEEGVIFCAHPDFVVGHPWYDWALIKWTDEDDLVPAKLKLFLDLSEAEIMTEEEHSTFCEEMNLNARGTQLHNSNPYPYLDKSQWVLIQSAIDGVEEESGRHPYKPTMKMCHRFKLEENYRLVPIEAISDVAFCFMSDLSEQEDDLTGVCLKPQDEWSDAFRNYFSDE